jgi:hypothetical protein
MPAGIFSPTGRVSPLPFHSQSRGQGGSRSFSNRPDSAPALRGMRSSSSPLMPGANGKYLLWVVARGDGGVMGPCRRAVMQRGGWTGGGRGAGGYNSTFFSLNDALYLGVGSPKRHFQSVGEALSALTRHTGKKKTKRADLSHIMTIARPRALRANRRFATDDEEANCVFQVSHEPPRPVP